MKSKAVRELERLTGMRFSVRYTGKGHRMLTNPAMRRPVVIAATASCGRSLQNAAHDVLRACRG